MLTIPHRGVLASVLTPIDCASLSCDRLLVIYSPSQLRYVHAIPAQLRENANLSRFCVSISGLAGLHEAHFGFIYLAVHRVLPSALT